MVTKHNQRLTKQTTITAQVLQTELTKGQQGLGFTIIGGDQVGEPLQIKHITPFGPAHSNGDLHPGWWRGCLVVGGLRKLSISFIIFGWYLIGLCFKKN